MLDDLLEHRVRIELRREQAAHARELLRERARAALRLVQLAALERSAHRVRELLRELEIVVGEAMLLREEDEDDAAALAARRLERHGEQRLVAGLARERLPLVTEAVVLRRPTARRSRAAPARTARGPARTRGSPSRRPAASAAGSSKPPASSSSPPRRGISTAVKSPPSASPAACAAASSVAVSESGSPSTVAMREKPRCTRAWRVRSSYVSAFRNASAASDANAPITSASRSPNERSPRAPTPTTPRVSFDQMIGATIASVNPRYASCGTGSGSTSYSAEMIGSPRRIASAATPRSAVNSKPTSSSGSP